MLHLYVALVNAVAAHEEAKHFTSRIRSARSPEELAAVLSVHRENEEHRKAIAVARAGAPQVTVINQIQHW